MSLEAEVDRGAKAHQLLTNTLYKESFASVEQALHDQWAASPVRDHEGQHELRLMLKLLGDVKSVLEATVYDGQAAAKRLEELNPRRVLSPAQWAKR